MKRRKFILGLVATSFVLPDLLRADDRFVPDYYSSAFEIITSNAKYGKWNELPFSEIMRDVAYEFIGTPYVGGTLEINSTEKCVVNLDKLDCVTFFENVLGLARMIKLEQDTFDALVKQVMFTRYRGGKIDGYVSRLHYTSDWIYDNVKKGTVRDMTNVFSGKEIQFNVSFMSEHPQYYRQLKNNSVLVDKIRKIEKAINGRTYYYVPKEDVAGIEFHLRSGDIIAIVNMSNGLDYSHTGLIYKRNETAYFMHASSVKKKVIIDKTISQYLVNSKKSNKGITILRPLEPENVK